MRYATFSLSTDRLPRLGIVRGDEIIDLRLDTAPAGRWPGTVPDSLLGLIQQGPEAWKRMRDIAEYPDSAHLAYGYAVAGQRADAKRLIEMLVASDRSRYLPPFHIALAYAGLGDKDAAFRWLERAYDEHASFMDGIKVTPGFDVLHSDPRFAALLERMHF